jgi:hypothetical protein
MADSTLLSGKCLGVYRGHDGTVYSLDAFWKNKEPTLDTIKKKQVSPKVHSIMLVTGICHPN